MKTIRSLRFLLFFAFLFQGTAAQDTQLKDRCESALAVTLGVDYFSSTTGIATEDDNQLDLTQCGDAGLFESNNPGVWFLYKADESRRLRLSTCAASTDFPTRITVFIPPSNDACSNQYCLASSVENDPNCLHENSTLLELPTVAGFSYQFFVHDEVLGVSGNFSFLITDISRPPENDSDCSAAVALVDGDTVEWTTVGASLSGGLQCARCIEGGPKNPGVFFSPTIGVTDEPSQMIVTVQGSSKFGSSKLFDISLYQGMSCGELNCKEVEITTEGLSTSISWVADSSEDYYLYVHAADSSEEDPITGRFGIQMSHNEGVIDMGSSAAEAIMGNASLLAMLLFCQCAFQ